MAETEKDLQAGYGLLRLEVDGEWPTGKLGSFLSSLSEGYGSILLLATIASASPEVQEKILRSVPFPENAPGLRAFQLHHVLYKLAPLMIESVRISSPGYIEVIGALNPLKVVADFITEYRRENTNREKIRKDQQLEEMRFKAQFVKDMIELRAKVEAMDPSGELTKRLAHEQFDIEHTLRAIAETDNLKAIEVREHKN